MATLLATLFVILCIIFELMSFTRLDEDIPTNVMLRVAYGGANLQRNASFTLNKWFCQTLVCCSSPSRLISAVTAAVLKSQLYLPPTPVGEQECPEVTEGRLLTHLMPCQRDNRMPSHTDCVFCLSSPLPPGWKSAQHTSCTTGGKTEEQEWEILIRSLFVVMTKPVRHFRCQLSNTRPPVVINSSRLLTHAPPAVLIEECALYSWCTPSPLGQRADWLQLTVCCWTTSNPTALAVMWKLIFIRKREANTVHYRDQRADFEWNSGMSSDYWKSFDVIHLDNWLM